MIKLIYSYYFRSITFCWGIFVLTNDIVNNFTLFIIWTSVKKMYELSMRKKKQLNCGEIKRKKWFCPLECKNDWID